MRIKRSFNINRNNQKKLNKINYNNLLIITKIKTQINKKIFYFKIHLKFIFLF